MASPSAAGAGPPAPRGGGAAAAAAAFKAYDVEVVVEQFARKIGALCPWGKYLIAGLGDGSLLFFEDPAGDLRRRGRAPDRRPDQQPPDQPAGWQVTRLEKAFCKKGILQLQVVLDSEEERRAGLGPALLCLTDDGAALHALPGLEARCSAPRSARGTAFSWHAGRRELALALASKRKAVTYRLAAPGDDRDDANGGGSWSLQELTEYALVDAADCLAWVGDSIVVGTKKGYFLIVPAPPQSVEVLPGQVVLMYPTVTPAPLFPLGCAPQPALAPLPPDGSGDGGGGAGGGGADGGGGGGGRAAAELLLCKDSGSFFVQADGKASRKAQLQWSEAPVALVAGDGYAVALLPGRIEVKSTSRISTPAAVQHLPLPGMAVAAPGPSPSDGSLFVASASAGGGVRRLRPVPLERQARLLAASGEFSGALELAARLPPARRRAMEDSLRLRFCHHLFESGDADDALTQLSMCSGAGPLLLLRLFPGLVPGKFRVLLPTEAYGEQLPPLGDAGDAGAAGAAGGAAGAGVGRGGAGAHGHAGPAGREAAAVGVVIPYLLSYRTRLLSAMDAQAAAAAAAAAGGAGRQGDAKQRPRQQKQRRPVLRPGQAAAAASAAEEAARQLPDDPLRPAAAPPEPSEASSADSAGAGAGAGGEGGEGGGEQPPPEVVARVLDTALLLAMLAQPDTGALLRLLQQRNFVDPEEGAAALGAAGRYAELAALYQYTGQNAEGLELLRRLSQDPGSLPVKPAGAAVDLSGLPGVWAAVRYLANMSPPDAQLAEAHAGWLLAADPEAGLEAFLQMRPALPAAMVLPILQRYAPDYCVVYLESALELGIASPGDFHSLLLMQYLAMALEEEQGGRDSAAKHARKLSLSDSLLAKARHPHEPLFPDAPLRPAGGAAGGAAGAAGGKGKLGEAKAGTDEAAPGAHGRGDAYERLKELVYSSPHIDPEVVLARLPEGRLPEIRALMLERLGRHREALSLYCHGVKSLAMAEAYCDRVYDAAVAAAAAAQKRTSAPASPRRPGSSGGGAPRPAALQPLLAKRGGSGGGGAAAARAAGGSAPGSPGGTRRGASGAPGLPLTMPPLPSFLGPPSDIYIELLEALIDGPPDASDASTCSKRQKQQPGGRVGRPQLDAAAWREAGAILSRKAARIDVAKVLGMLPDGLPLACLSPLLGAMLQHATERSRNLAVVRNLRRGENLAAREEEVWAKQRHVVLTSDRACCMCHKRIGASVLVAHPSGRLAHYLCYKRAGEAEGGGGGGGGANGAEAWGPPAAAEL